jgi:GNAT superfamily N-acetyltransferase
MMDSGGYLQAAVREDRVVRAVAGYRYMDMLYCGRILYVDDLVTDERTRSQGLGKRLIEWLTNEARAKGCAELHLDSGVQREHAHRFYFREGLTINAYHFRKKVGRGKQKRRAEVSLTAGESRRATREWQAR